MNKLISDKRGTDKIISVYWFAILAIVAVGIASIVIIFYGKPYDIRDAETEILINKIADCLVKNGELNNSLRLEDCPLNLEDINYEEIQYYIRVSFFDINNFKTKEEIDIGNKNFLSSCEIQNEDYNKIVKCKEKRLYAFDENQQIIIRILSAVRKTEKNIS